MNNLLTRRHFFQAIAASVIAAGAPLPIGFPDLDELATAPDYTVRFTKEAWVTFNSETGEIIDSGPELLTRIKDGRRYFGFSIKAKGPAMITYSREPISDEEAAKLSVV